MSAEAFSDKTPLASGQVHYPGQLADEFRIPLERALREGLGRAELPLSDPEEPHWDEILDILDESLEPWDEEGRLRRSRDLLQRILDSLPLEVFWKDGGSHYLGANRRFLAEAGLESPAELLGLSDFDLPWRERAEKCRDEDYRLMHQGLGRLETEEMRQGADGDRRWFRKVKEPVRDAGGEPLGVIGYCQEITGAREEADAEAGPARPGALGRLLLAGGGHALREGLRRGAEEAGCVVDWAPDAPAVKAALRFGLFDLVLADGDDNRLDALTLCRELGPGAPPFLVLSARPAVDVAALCREAGASELLPKPLEPAQLRRVLDRWLGESESLPA